MDKQNENLFGSILIADDEQTFLKSTAQLLCNEGFECDCAEDSTAALDKLSKKTYDLLITDIKMPGNSNLELIRELSENMPIIKVILVTAYPSQQTAIEAVRLPIAAYLVKPVDFPELLEKAKHAVKLSQLNRIVAATRKNFQQWTSELENIELSLQHGKCNSFKETFESFLESVTIKIDEAFKSAQQAIGLLDTSKQETQICQVVQCEALAELTEGIEQAVTVLKDSRELYKSKQLAKTRATLEKLLKNIPKNSAKGQAI
ncbi:MAG: response regulator [Sedimentisphaerales bacterium]